MKYSPTITRQTCQDFADSILRERSWQKRAELTEALIASLPESESPKTWQGYLKRFASWCRAVSEDFASLSDCRFSIFIKTGNVKLPFVSFSCLPGFTCPGAGACLKYCYSYRAWRYPAGFLRQLQNTLLMQTSAGRSVISEAFHCLKPSRKTARLTMRLYVDGDFASVDEFTYWMQLIHSRSDCDAYGYSKSWREILAAVSMTADLEITRYVLNVSGGSLHSADLRDQVLRLPFVRQVFDAVPIEGDGLPAGFAKYDSADYHQRTRSAYQEETGNKGFSCPGRCGDCRAASGRHACGDLQFSIPIVIGIH